MFGTITENQALFNTKIKIYPDGSTSTTYCDTPIFHYSNIEKHDKSTFIPLEPLDSPFYCGFPRPDPNNPHYLERFKSSENASSESSDKIYHGNIKRAKDSIFDIVMCNEWDYFFTGTFNDNLVGENTACNLLKPLQDWLKNQTKRKGLAYVLVAEYSPLNHRIHFHGLINSALSMSDSGTVLCVGKGKPIKVTTADRLKIPSDNRRTVFNIDSWSERFGFTTAIPVTGERIQLARYITKYITKDSEKIFGKYFWSSKNIVRSPQIQLCNTPDFLSINQPEHYIKGCNFVLKYDCSFHK